MGLQARTLQLDPCGTRTHPSLRQMLSACSSSGNEGSGIEPPACSDPTPPASSSTKVDLEALEIDRRFHLDFPTKELNFLLHAGLHMRDHPECSAEFAYLIARGKFALVPTDVTATCHTCLDKADATSAIEVKYGRRGMVQSGMREQWPALTKSTAVPKWARADFVQERKTADRVGILPVPLTRNTQRLEAAGAPKTWPEAEARRLIKTHAKFGNSENYGPPLHETAKAQAHHSTRRDGRRAE